MMCHRTSNGRRGFYGFGEGAEAVYDEDGVLIEDYKDDVHKGKVWTEANGEARAIENCNACHARNYYNRPSDNVDLNANHNFLKGNSDMDVRNDLDYVPGAKSCEYCHNDAANPAIPSGHADMLSAHLERWKASGDLAGYPRDTLMRITQTHLDTVSCQACHINGKMYRGNPITSLYRYREGEDGSLKITPFKIKPRYYWKDKNSGRVLNKTERNSVFRLVETDTETYGIIVDPETGEELARVSARFSHGSWRFGDPDSYTDFIALKRAYDKVLSMKGVQNADTVLVWTEVNAYLLSHNTRPAVSSVQCEECHERKQDGSFSSLLSPDGLLGENNVKTVTTLVDPRLITEGVVELDLPYMQVDDAGVVTENAADILYATSMDPSMSILKSASADVAAGILRRMTTSAGVDASGVTDTADAEILKALFTTGEVFLFRSNHGNANIRAVAMLSEVNGQTELLFPSYRVQVAIGGDDVTTSASNAGLGDLLSDVFSLEARDSNSNVVDNFGGNRVLVKLPYDGDNANPDEVKVIYSSDGSNWSLVAADDVVMIKPQNDGVKGYLVFWTDHFSHYAIVNAAQNDDSSSGADDSAAGGCTLHRNAPFDPLLPLLLAISGLYLWRRRTGNHNRHSNISGSA